MQSNLVPVQTVDVNGHRRIVYKTADGRGRPSIAERKDYKMKAKRTPSHSPYRLENDIYADDYPIGETDLSNGVSHVRRHDDGMVELISYDVDSNIDLSEKDLNALLDLGDGGDSKRHIDLSFAGNARIAADGALVITREVNGVQRVEDIPAIATSVLLDKLAEWV